MRCFFCEYLLYEGIARVVFLLRPVSGCGLRFLEEGAACMLSGKTDLWINAARLALTDNKQERLIIVIMHPSLLSNTLS